MKNFDEALEALDKRGRDSILLQRNTHLERLDADVIGVKFYNTFVVTYHRNGTVKIDTGGWKTVTTKDRINAYSEAGIYIQKGQWYLSDGTIFDQDWMWLSLGAVPLPESCCV